MKRIDDRPGLDLGDVGRSAVEIIPDVEAQVRTKSIAHPQRKTIQVVLATDADGGHKAFKRIDQAVAIGVELRWRARHDAEINRIGVHVTMQLPPEFPVGVRAELADETQSYLLVDIETVVHVKRLVWLAEQSDLEPCCVAHLKVRLHVHDRTRIIPAGPAFEIDRLVPRADQRSDGLIDGPAKGEAGLALGE